MNSSMKHVPSMVRAFLWPWLAVFFGECANLLRRGVDFRIFFAGRVNLLRRWISLRVATFSFFM